LRGAGRARPAGPRDRLSERRGCAFVDDDLVEDTLELGLVDHRGLVGLDLDQRLAPPNRLAGLLEPLDHGRLLALVGQARHRDLDRRRLHHTAARVEEY
jgi:hypothetical protein